MTRRLTITGLLLIATLITQGQADLFITQANGLKVSVVSKNYPLLKLLLPGQPVTDRGIEIEFPEHVTGVAEATNQVKQFYFVTRGNANKRTLPVWRKDGSNLIYESDLNNEIRIQAKVLLEADGLRYTYELSNHSGKSYTNLQAVTCVKLYSLFSDTLMQRTYVHHPDGFDLLASETPETVRRRQDWLPCRYLVSYRWDVNPKPVEKVDGVTRYNKSRKVDRPFIATYSRDKVWIAATYTKETGNLWNNPERSCQHADPNVNLKNGETKKLELKTFVMKSDLDRLLETINAEMKK